MNYSVNVYIMCILLFFKTSHFWKSSACQSVPGVHLQRAPVRHRGDEPRDQADICWEQECNGKAKERYFLCDQHYSAPCRYQLSFLISCFFFPLSWCSTITDIFSFQICRGVFCKYVLPIISNLWIKIPTPLLQVSSTLVHSSGNVLQKLREAPAHNLYESSLHPSPHP